MAILPLVSLVNKGESAKSFAIIEALVLVPFIAILVGYLLGSTGLSPEIRMAVAFMVGIPLAGLYARFASS